MTSDSFVQVSECLPTAHVAFLTLDAFETIYPSAALPLKARCLELNPKGITGASTCVVQAISAAVKLAASLPAGSTLDDPIFDAVADPALKVKLDAEIDAAQSAFPDQMMWGGGLYHPYR